MTRDPPGAQPVAAADAAVLQQLLETLGGEQDLKFRALAAPVVRTAMEATRLRVKARLTLAPLAAGLLVVPQSWWRRGGLGNLPPTWSMLGSV